jgi:1,4-dihydroxy-2-naphthoyl-CoA hydrolase
VTTGPTRSCGPATPHWRAEQGLALRSPITVDAVSDDGIGIEHFRRDIADRFLATDDKLDGIAGFLGFKHISFEPGEFVCDMPITDELVTMIGNIHGGCISAQVDHCLGVTLYPHMPKGYWAATTEFKINLLAPVSKGVCRATARILVMTKRTAVIRIDVENEGRLVAAAQGTCTVQPPRKR